MTKGVNFRTQFVVMALSLVANATWCVERLVSQELTASQKSKVAVAERLHRETEELHGKGQLKQAIARATQALEIYQDTLGNESLSTANSMRILAALFQSAGEYATSREHYDKARAIQIKIVGISHPEVARTDMLVASLLIEQEKYDDAGDVLTRALVVQRLAHALEPFKNHAEVCEMLDMLGQLRKWQRKFAECRPLFEEATAIRRKVLGGDHIETAKSLDRLGELLMAMQDYSAAQKTIEESIRIKEKKLGPEARETADSLKQLAAVLHESDEQAKAQQILRRVLTLDKKHYGTRHPATADTIATLGSVAVELKQTSEARALFEEALAILRDTSPNAHSEIIAIIIELGILANSQKDYANALKHFSAGMEIGDKALGDEDTDVIFCQNMSGMMLLHLNRFNDARRHWERLIAIRRRLFAERDEHVAYAEQELGRTLHALGEYQTAKSHLETALRVRREVLGAEHRETADSLFALGDLLGELAQFEESKACHEQALAIRKKVCGELALETFKSHMALGEILFECQDLKGARRCYEEAARIGQSAPDEPQFDTASALDSLGNVLAEHREFVLARLAMERAYAIRRKTKGEDHPEVALSLNNLGILSDAQQDMLSARRYYDRALAICDNEPGVSIHAKSTIYRNLALCLDNLGDDAAACECLDKLLKLMKQAEESNARGLASTRSVLDTAHTLDAIVDVAQSEATATIARRLAEKSLEIRQRLLGDAHPFTSNSHNRLGLILQNQGDYANARLHFEKAYAQARDAKERLDGTLAVYAHNLGMCCLDEGDAAGAQRHLPAALEYARKSFGDGHSYTVTALSSLAIAAMRYESHSQAMAFHDQAQRGARHFVTHILFGLSDKEQLQFLRRHHVPMLHGGLSLAVLEKRPEVAITSAGWILNAKGVAYRASAHRNLLAREEADSEVAEWSQKLREVRRGLANLAFGAAVPEQGESRREAIDRLSNEESALMRDIARKTARPELMAPWVELSSVRDEIPQDGVMVEIVRFNEFNFRPEGQEAGSQAARYAAWLIPPTGKGDVSIVELGLAAEIDASVANAVESIALAGRIDGAVRTLGEHEATQRLNGELARIADVVWKPLVAKMPSGTKHLILCPDGALWMLPWAALPIAENRCLLEEYSLHYEVGGGELVRSSATVDRINPPVICADPEYDSSPTRTRDSIRAIFPGLEVNDFGSGDRMSRIPVGKFARLPNTKVEAEAVSPNMNTVAKAAPQQFLGRYALESVVKRVRSPRVLMLSTHGFFLPDQEVKTDDRPLKSIDGQRSAAVLTVEGTPVENPLLRCGLLFAGCNSNQSVGGDDGVLTGMEVLDMDLRGTELVVLSACETSVGKVVNGEGVAGLRHAFHLAGAQSVVATLWQVPDRDSVIIMNEFFKNLADGQSRAEALRNAQLSRIRSRRDRNGAAHPYFWAAWTIAGR